MCQKTKVLARTKNGSLLYCTSCGMYHLSFGHFYLELDTKELGHFGTFLGEIDPDYWEDRYCHCGLRRHIPIPTLQGNLFLMLDRSELEELKRLVFYREGESSPPLIDAGSVDYELILN